MHQMEVYNIFLNFKKKEAMKVKHEKNDLSKSQNVWKGSIKALYILTLYLHHFSSILNDLKS
jgi:hypothetical protein